MNAIPVAAQAARPEILLAAVIYLMTHYARTGCPNLAVCVSRHLQSLCTHPEVDPIIRDICASLRGTWAQPAACATASLQ